MKCHAILSPRLTIRNLSLSLPCLLPFALPAAKYTMAWSSHLLADVDEWAQITILSVLTRYLRTQFVDPAPAVHYETKMTRVQCHTFTAICHSH